MTEKMHTSLLSTYYNDSFLGYAKILDSIPEITSLNFGTRLKTRKWKIEIKKFHSYRLWQFLFDNLKMWRNKFGFHNHLK
jgi:hypothetical protein